MDKRIKYIKEFRDKKHFSVKTVLRDGRARYSGHVTVAEYTTSRSVRKAENRGSSLNNSTDSPYHPPSISLLTLKSFKKDKFTLYD